MLHDIRAGDTIKRMADNHSDVCGSYDDATHSMTVYAAITSATDFDAWQPRAAELRNEATRVRSTVIPDVWILNPSAPILLGEPIAAVRYSRQARAFLPVVNICCWRQAQFVQAKAIAIAAASDAMIHAEKTGELPAEIDGLEVFYPSAMFQPGRFGAEVESLLSRFNA